MAENIQLSNYANNTQSGEHWGHLIDVKYNVPYPLGRRDLIFFIISSPDGLENYVDDSFNPQFAVAVCNHTKLRLKQCDFVFKQPNTNVLSVEMIRLNSNEIQKIQREILNFG